MKRCPAMSLIELSEGGKQLLLTSRLSWGLCAPESEGIGLKLSPEGNAPTRWDLISVVVCFCCPIIRGHTQVVTCPQVSVWRYTTRVAPRAAGTTGFPIGF